MAVVDGEYQECAMQRLREVGEAIGRFQNSRGVRKDTTIDDGKESLRETQADTKQSSTAKAMFGSARQVYKNAELAANRATDSHNALDNASNMAPTCDDEEDGDEDADPLFCELSGIVGIGTKRVEKSSTRPAAVAPSRTNHGGGSGGRAFSAPPSRSSPQMLPSPAAPARRPPVWPAASPPRSPLPSASPSLDRDEIDIEDLAEQLGLNLLKKNISNKSHDKMHPVNLYVSDWGMVTDLCNCWTSNGKLPLTYRSRS